MPRRNPELSIAHQRLRPIAAQQEGTVTRQQARTAGLPPDAIARLVDSGRWVRLHRGVYRTEPGTVPLRARMWAAHLALGPSSVVGGAAAAHYWDLVEGEPRGPLTVLVPQACTRAAVGVRSRRIPDPQSRAHPVRQPPVTTVEHTVCDVVSASDSDAAAVEVILRACRLRLTSPGRILDAARDRPRLRRRALLKRVCQEAVDEVTSPLESEYRRRVARAHGLPLGRGQVADLSMGSRRVYRDIEYPEQGVLVELDGRLGHEQESEVLRDQFRDNCAVLTGRATLRFGWLAVVGESCQSASQVYRLLRIRGWTGTPRPCRPGCPVLTTEAGLAGFPGRSPMGRGLAARPVGGMAEQPPRSA